MASPRFFSLQELPRPLAEGAAFEVGEDITRHLQVLRLDPAEQIVLFDGMGGEFRAEIVELAKRRTSMRLLHFDAVERESPLAITLVQALATSDKLWNGFKDSLLWQLHNRALPLLTGGTEFVRAE